MMSDRFHEAFKFAHGLHRRQVRNDTSIPYISRLITVAALVGPKIKPSLGYCIMPQRTRAMRQRWTPDSLLVLLADKTHNAEAILWDYRRHGEDLWSRFNGGAGGARWYYGELAKVFERALLGGLSDRLSQAVAGFAV